MLAFSIVHGNAIYDRKVVCSRDEHGVETHHIYLKSRFYKLLYMLLPLHYLILKKYTLTHIRPGFKFSIIHSNILFPCAIVGRRLSKAFDCRHVISEHWSKLDKFFRVSLYRRAGRKALDQASAITSVSGTLSAILKKYTKNKNIVIVPNVIDSAQFHFRPEISKNDVFTFIAVAHWAAPKNPFYFLNALQELHTEGKLSKIKVVLVGTGAQLETIKQAGYAFDIDYKGNMNAQDLNAAFNKSHLFLHGSDFETFSVVIAEALLAGTPCVVSPVGIAPEVINPFNGFIAANTVADWKEKILKAYHTSYDAPAIARALQGKYDLETVGDLFDHVYSNI